MIRAELIVEWQSPAAFVGVIALAAALVVLLLLGVQRVVVMDDDPTHGRLWLLLSPLLFAIRRWLRRP